MSLLKSQSDWRIALHSSIFLISYKIPAVKTNSPLSLCNGLKLRFCFLICSAESAWFRVMSPIALSSLSLQMTAAQFPKDQRTIMMNEHC